MNWLSTTTATHSPPPTRVTRILTPIAVAALALLAPIFPSAHAEEAMRFERRTLTVDGILYRYMVAIPEGWTKDRAWPTVLFLHGAGERGSRGKAPARVGLGPRLRTHPWPAVVVFPQCPKSSFWPDPQMLAMASAALDAAILEFHGDRKRLYLTGISMGGYGAIQLAAASPGKFAAVVPICGGVLPPWIDPAERARNAANAYADVAKRLGQTPIWLFHGDADKAIPVSESRQLAQALRDAGGNVRYTEYPGLGHNSWDAAYAEESLYQWLLKQSI